MTATRAGTASGGHVTRAEVYRRQALIWLALGDTTMAQVCDRAAQQCQLLVVSEHEEREHPLIRQPRGED